jgi:2-amino-4-hydroxy-6-hydroxymethyldihydropteridine diphosphokinase
VGIEGGADFLNGAAEVETRLSARELLDRLLEIERRYGRSRDTEQTGGGHRNRTLDLDLLLYGNEKIDQPGLVVPHPRILEREFVLVPLAELGKIPPFFRSVEATASE